MVLEDLRVFELLDGCHVLAEHRGLWSLAWEIEHEVLRVGHVNVAHEPVVLQHFCHGSILVFANAADVVGAPRRMDAALVDPYKLGGRALWLDAGHRRALGDAQTLGPLLVGLDRDLLEVLQYVRQALPVSLGAGSQDLSQRLRTNSAAYTRINMD